MTNKMLKCRPQGCMVDRPWPNPTRIKPFLKMNYSRKGWNWHERGPFIEDPQVRIHAAIHYLTCHAPRAVQARWKTAEKRWRDRCRWWRGGINDRL